MADSLAEYFMASVMNDAIIDCTNLSRNTALIGDALAIIQQKDAPHFYFVCCPTHDEHILTACVDGKYPVNLLFGTEVVGRWERWLNHPQCKCSALCRECLETSPIDVFQSSASFATFNVPCWSRAKVTLPALVTN